MSIRHDHTQHTELDRTQNRGKKDSAFSKPCAHEAFEKRQKAISAATLIITKLNLSYGISRNNLDHHYTKNSLDSQAPRAIFFNTFVWVLCIRKRNSHSGEISSGFRIITKTASLPGWRSKKSTPLTISS